ncbi:2TM domain-containing protein [Flavobacterium restrictum]|uniref:2TM domain-containing protein n=1 Tax=Flavobacterium restrictum TaxID=2594428 RepID=A0A553EBM3_9FLAO|nr:2TM domain-containing protein [Flavobacterium restrictum]TRX42355.1 2TM domain-containing protein [Flavobacterium restrictum]
MESTQHEQYEYARSRLKQKKRLYFHFVLFVLVSIFLFVANHFFEICPQTNWCIWVITFWLFLFTLHFIKVFITDRFMNKNWERDQINRLMALQEKKISQLQHKIEEDDLTKTL